jgi:hypothetical protein
MSNVLKETTSKLNHNLCITTITTVVVVLEQCFELDLFFNIFIKRKIHLFVLSREGTIIDIVVEIMQLMLLVGK